MCTGLTKICGYGVQVSHIRHLIDPDKVLAYIQSSPVEGQFSVPEDGWISRYVRGCRETKMQMLEDDCLPENGGLAAIIVSAAKNGEVIGVDTGEEGCALLHLPEYPWSESLIDRAKSQSALYNAVVRFLGWGVDHEAVQELTDYYGDADECNEVFAWDNL